MSEPRRPPANLAPLPRLARAGLRVLLRAVARSRPRVRAAAGATGPALGRGARALGRGLLVLGALARRRRALVIAFACRAAWWSALAIFASAGAALLGFTVESVDAGLWRPFALGLSLCAAVVLVARERHLRWLATALGTSHAVLGLLAFGALQG